MKFVQIKRELLKMMCNPDARRTKIMMMAYWKGFERKITESRTNQLERCEALWRRQTIYNRQQILALHSPDHLNGSVRRRNAENVWVDAETFLFLAYFKWLLPPSIFCHFFLSFFISYFFWFLRFFFSFYISVSFRISFISSATLFAVSFAISVFLRFPSYSHQPHFFSFFYLIAFLCVRFLFFLLIAFPTTANASVSLCVWFALYTV